MAALVAVMDTDTLEAMHAAALKTVYNADGTMYSPSWEEEDSRKAIHAEWLRRADAAEAAR
jgi:hypothetical protein